MSNYLGSVHVLLGPSKRCGVTSLILLSAHTPFIFLLRGFNPPLLFLVVVRWHRHLQNAGFPHASGLHIQQQPLLCLLLTLPPFHAVPNLSCSLTRFCLHNSNFWMILNEVQLPEQGTALAIFATRFCLQAMKKNSSIKI